MNSEAVIGRDPVLKAMDAQLLEMEKLEERMDEELDQLKNRMDAAVAARQAWLKAMFYDGEIKLPAKPSPKPVAAAPAAKKPAKEAAKATPKKPPTKTVTTSKPSSTPSAASSTSSDVPKGDREAQLTTGETAPEYDPNVNGQGYYVEGVNSVIVADNADFKICLWYARGINGLYRTGHKLLFTDPEAASADQEVAAREDGQAVSSLAYAIRTRANIVINYLQDTEGSTWTPRQKTIYAKAIKQLNHYLSQSPKTKEEAAS